MFVINGAETTGFKVVGDAGTQGETNTRSDGRLRKSQPAAREKLWKRDRKEDRSQAGFRQRIARAQREDLIKDYRVRTRARARDLPGVFDFAEFTSIIMIVRLLGVSLLAHDRAQ